MAQVNPMYGAVAGAGGGTLAAIGVRQFADPTKHPKLFEYSEAIGFGVGALTGGAMLLLGKKKWKAAGYTALLSALVNNGLRQIELSLLGGVKPTLKVNIPIPGLPGSGNMGIVDIEQTGVLRDAVVDQTTVLNGGEMPQLVGANLQAANAHVQLVGAPPLAEHAASWGSTLFG
jgi:hypothetical protein